MKKQEFKDLYQRKDDISTKKISNLLIKYTANTNNKDTLECLAVLDTLMKVNTFMEEIDKSNIGLITKPYTIQDAYDMLRMRIINNYIETLED
jgi:hypothetical protein